MRTACIWIVAAMNAAALALAAASAIDAVFYSTGFGRSFSIGLSKAFAGAMVPTTLPALVLVPRRPWPALALALVYPLAWVAIMKAL